MTLSMAFIISKVRAIGLRLFRVLMVFFFGMGMTVECFHIWGMVQLCMDL